MLLELVYHGRDAVVPQLDDVVAEGRAYPRTDEVEGEPLHSGGLLFVNMLFVVSVVLLSCCRLSLCVLIDDVCLLCVFFC